MKKAELKFGAILSEVSRQQSMVGGNTAGVTNVPTADCELLTIDSNA